MLKFAHTHIQTRTRMCRGVCQSDQNPKMWLISWGAVCFVWIYSQLNVAVLVGMLNEAVPVCGQDSARVRVMAPSREEKRPVHAAMHAHALELVCTAETARLPGQHGGSEKKYFWINGQCANISRAELGNPGRREFVTCQNPERLRWGLRSCKYRCGGFFSFFRRRTE